MPSQETRSHRVLFGVREEYIVAAMVLPLLFGCLFTEPFIVEVENFNSGSPSESLVFAGGDNQSVSFNISKYVVVGNWSNQSIFTNFTVQLCPTAGTPSNLRIYWPYTNGSSLMWAGNLVSCQNVSVNTSEFDPYFHTEMGIIIDFIALTGGGGSPSMPTNFNTMMMREPHMYDVSEDVTFTMLTPENIPSEIGELLYNETGQNFSMAEMIGGLAYTCYDGDSYRYVYTPAERIAISFDTSQFGGLPIPIPIPLSNLNGSALIYDMPCPPYLTEGEYRAEVKLANMSLNNTPGNYSVRVFFDDFDTPSFNGTAWLTFSQTGPEIAYYEDNWASGTYDMYSLGATSGIITYYNRSLQVDDSNSAWVEFYLDTSELGTIMTESAGVLVFANETVEPGVDVDIGPFIRGDIIFGNDTWAAVCPDQSFPPPAMGAFAPGWHTFAVNFTNDTQFYYVDGSNVLNCTNYTSEMLYAGISPDPLTNQFYGNASVDWANVTTYGGGAVTSAMFDDFDSALNTSRWLPMPVNGTYAYYDNDYNESKLWMYSYSPSNASGIISYLVGMPILSPDELYQNVSAMNVSDILNLSNITNVSITNFTLTDVGWDISFGIDTTDANASDWSIGFYLTNSTLPPSTKYTTLTDSMRGGLFINGTYGMAVCPNGTVLGAGPLAPGNYTFHLISTNTSFDMSADGFPIGSCPPVNETLFVTLTSDYSTEQFDGGKVSFNNVSVSAFAAANVSGWAWIPIPPGYAFADVIVCDCPDKWNRAFDFNISSDTAGTVDVTIVNISYRNLIDYSNSQPTLNIDNEQFSWMAYDSNISDSPIRYQTGIGRSNIDDSKIIMADIDCANVSNSNLTGAVYISRNLSKILMKAGIPDPGLPFGDLPCGKIENSEVVGCIFIGGDIINSQIYGIPMIFTDFENAHISSFYLSEGNMTVNITRWAPQVANTSIGGMPTLNELPLGCANDTIFAFDGVQGFSLKDTNTSTLDCWMKFVSSWNSSIDNVNFNNSIGGPTVSLFDSSLWLRNMNYDFNVKLKQPEAYAIIYGLNNGVYGDMYLSSEYQYMENSMIAMNSTAYDFLNGKTVLVVFENVASYDGSIYYYPGFTTNYSIIVQNGTECNVTCQNITHDAATETLSFITTNFSSYAIVRLDPPSPPGGGGNELKRMSAARDYLCPDDILHITITGTTGLPLSDARVAVQYLDVAGYVPQATVYTDSEGIAETSISKDGEYRISVSADGYQNLEESFSLTLCPQEQIPPEEQPEEETNPEEETTPEAPQEVTPEVPPEEVAPSEPIVPPEVETPPSSPSVEPPPEEKQECCLIGICGAFVGICWYWWILGLIIILIIIALIASGTIFAIGKSGGYKPRNRK